MSTFAILHRPQMSGLQLNYNTASCTTTMKLFIVVVLIGKGVVNGIEAYSINAMGMDMHILPSNNALCD